MWLRDRAPSTLQHFLQPGQGPFTVGVLAPARLVDNGDPALGVDFITEVVLEVALFAFAESCAGQDVKDKLDAGFGFVDVLASRAAGAGSAKVYFSAYLGPVHRVVGLSGCRVV